MRAVLLLASAVCLFASVQASSDDRFIKKYAMMKIYESCFGQEVVKQIRQEMKDACAKCSATPPPAPEHSANQQPPNLPALLGKLPLGFSIDPNLQSITRPNENKFGANPGEGDGELNNESDAGDQNTVNPGFNRFQFAFSGYRPASTPVAGSNGGLPPYLMPQQYRPYGGAATTPYYQFPYPNAYYPGAFGYNPYQQQYPSYQQQPYYQQPYYGSQRMSKELALRDRLEMISRSSGAGAPRMRNITCVMQELGYLDHNLEPNYEKITRRIANLPVSAELRGDIQDGLQFCQKFASCVPDVKKDASPLSKELVKPMFFFRCYKHKKLEACIMKDIRERFTSEEELESESETDFRSIARNGRSLKDQFGMNDPQLEALDEMTVYMYDFLSGSNNFDFDLYM